jgi:hypothetical protein
LSAFGSVQHVLDTFVVETETGAGERLRTHVKRPENRCHDPVSTDTCTAMNTTLVLDVAQHVMIKFRMSIICIWSAALAVNVNPSCAKARGPLQVLGTPQHICEWLAMIA